jgi:signal transduction histidine kinase
MPTGNRAEAGDELTAAVRGQLLDPASWREPLEGYARATKLAVMMVDAGGVPLGPCVNPQRLWSLVRAQCGKTEQACPFCLHPEPCCHALQDAERTRAVSFARDRAGVVHMVVPVTLTGRTIAFILAGQVFDRFPEQLLLDHLARATGCSPPQLWDIARREVPVGRQVLQAYGDLLSTLAGSYVRANYAAIVDRQRYAEILGLHADLAERQQIESALREADRRKDEFLATLAHELRNPLAPMMTAVHLLDQTEASHPTAERARATLNRQVRHMVRLVDDLLDVSRITRGRIQLQRRPVRLSEVIASAIETSRPEIDQKQHHLLIDDGGGELMLDIDPVRISQALANLLTNAARYMEVGGQVRVSVIRDADVVAVTVADKGIGLAPDHIDDVFDMFVRGSDSHRAAPSGLGIGLSLAKRLVELHGGTLAVSSAGPGKGSEFTIRLPAPDLAIVADNDTEKDHFSLSTCRILVVEDNDDSREMLTQVLTLKGHDVRSAGDGPSALNVAQAWSPEIVILDIGLPGMSGYEVARQLRQRQELNGIVLVALTGWGQEQDRQRSSAAGIAHHLTKPVDPDTLDRLLGAICKP